MDQPDDKPVPPKKRGKRASKAASRAKLLTDARDGGLISSKEAEKLAKRVKADLAPVDPETAAEVAAVVEPYIGEPTPVLAVATRSRVTTYLSDEDQQQFIRFIDAGYNREAAAKLARVAYNRVRATLLDFPEFREEVIVSELAREGHCQQVIYEKALTPDNPDIGCAGLFIRNAHAVREMHRANRLKRAELLLKKREVDAKLQETAASDYRPDFTVFADHELDDYNGLCDKVQSGADLTPEELTRYGAYQVALARASARRVEGPPGVGGA